MPSPSLTHMLLHKCTQTDMSKQSDTSTHSFPSPIWFSSPTDFCFLLSSHRSHRLFLSSPLPRPVSASSRLLPSLCGRLIIWVNVLCLAELFPVKAPLLHRQYNYEAHGKLMNTLDKYRRSGRQLRGWHLLSHNRSCKKIKKLFNIYSHIITCQSCLTVKKVLQTWSVTKCSWQPVTAQIILHCANANIIWI